MCGSPASLRPGLEPPAKQGVSSPAMCPSPPGKRSYSGMGLPSGRVKSQSDPGQAVSTTFNPALGPAASTPGPADRPSGDQARPLGQRGPGHCHRSSPVSVSTICRTSGTTYPLTYDLALSRCPDLEPPVGGQGLSLHLGHRRGLQKRLVLRRLLPLCRHSGGTPPPLSPP